MGRTHPPACLSRQSDWEYSGCARLNRPNAQPESPERSRSQPRRSRRRPYRRSHPRTRRRESRHCLEPTRSSAQPTSSRLVRRLAAAPPLQSTPPTQRSPHARASTKLYSDAENTSTSHGPESQSDGRDKGMATVPTGRLAARPLARLAAEIASRVSASLFSSGALGHRPESEGYATGAQLANERRGRGTSDLATGVRTRHQIGGGRSPVRDEAPRQDNELLNSRRAQSVARHSCPLGRAQGRTALMTYENAISTSRSRSGSDGTRTRDLRRDRPAL